MKNYAVIQHNYSEFLGLIEGQLEIRDIGFSYFRPFVGLDLPGTALHFDALFVLNASYPVHHPAHEEWIEQERRLLNIFLVAKRPVVGIGHGAMLLAEHAGATLHDEPMHNAYWTTAHITPEGQGDEVAEAVNGRKVLVFTNGRADLPDTVKPILVDDKGDWIAIHPSPFAYGLLFRPELKPGMIEDMIMEADRPTPENIGELLAEARSEWNQTQTTTQKLIVALVSSLDLMKERKKAPVFRLKVEE